MRYLEELINSKTLHCTHNNGCLYQIIRYIIKNLKYGFIISFSLQFIKTLQSLIKGKESLKKSFKIQYFTITLFMCSTVLMLKLIKCILRRFRQTEDWVNSFVAGMAAGWVASKTLSPKYWYLYLTFVGSRIIGAIHKYLLGKGYLKKQNSHIHSYLMFMIAHGVHSYGYFTHPHILNNDMMGLYTKMSALTPQQNRWHLASLQDSFRRIKKQYGTYPEYDKITQSRIKYLQGVVQKQRLQGKH